MSRWSYSSRDTVEESLIFTAADTLKKLIDSPDFMFSYTWAKKLSGIIPRIYVTYRQEKEALEFNYTITRTQENLKYYVPIIKQACNYGNYRYYFECPNTNCHAKVYKLYKAPSSKYFLCRKCQNLTYEEQKAHNKSMDGFAWIKYSTKIEKLLNTGKVKDYRKALKLIKRRDKLLNKHRHLIEWFMVRIKNIRNI